MTVVRREGESQSSKMDGYHLALRSLKQYGHSGKVTESAMGQCTAQDRGAGVWVNFEMPLTQKRRCEVSLGGSSGWLDH